MDIDLLKQVESLSPPAIIAISGFGGSGKSSLSAQLGQHLELPVISVDSFIRDRHLVDYALWDWIDYDRLEREVLIPFSSDATSIEYGDFDWNANAVGSRKAFDHCGRAIVEGVGLLRPSLLKYFAFSIWVQCPLEEAIRRGKRRDREVYNNPQDENWDGIWLRNDEEFYRHYQPHKIADYVYDNSARKA